MAKRKRAKKPEPVKEEPKGEDFKEKLKTFFDTYGFLPAFAGAVPLISGYLLFQDKECGCFLLPKDVLHANSEFLGIISIIAGLALVIPAVFQYAEKGKGKKKDLKIRYEYLFAFILAVGLAVFYIGLETQPEVPAAEGEYDELAIKLTEREWVMFYSNLCDHCHDQFDMLGTSVKYLKLVDCETVACPDFVEGYPTWARTNPDGSLEIEEGPQSIETLKQMAGLVP